MGFYMLLRCTVQSLFERVENLFDIPFGAASNPLRHLGALCLFFLWLLVGTGLYLYIVLDTSIEGVYHSISALSTQPWHVGGVVRTLHRYVSDGFVLVMVLHLVREWAYGRYHGFRFYSWITGVPLIWFSYISGIGGYWIVWDEVAQFSATASAELLDWLPFFNEPVARNFLAPYSVSDRLFTVLVFIHIGVPLMMILGVWVHLNRISRVDYLPSRNLMVGTTITLVVMALMQPAMSGAPANMLVVTPALSLDWFFLFIHPLTEWTSPAFVWTLIFGLTLLLFALPLLPHPRAQPVAVVDAPNCNGCRRCYFDCPYAAVDMVLHPVKRGHQIAVVDADLCASCGICAGSCPSSTPFRSQEKLVTGIDMPHQPVDVMRKELEAQLDALSGAVKLVVFGCASAVDVLTLRRPDTAVMRLQCTGMLPPSFVEYALRSGADGVVVTGCRDGGCDFRLGMEWTRDRLGRRREPHLREMVPLERLRIIPSSRSEHALLAAALVSFRAELESTLTLIDRPHAYTRRTRPHA